MYPLVNERSSAANYDYPGMNDNYQPNNTYVPTAPTAYSNPYPSNNNPTQTTPNSNPYQPNNNPTQTTTINNQAMNAATVFGNQAAATHHGAGLNPTFQEDQLMNKDLQNTLEGSARAGFIRKVYSLLTIQLLITIVIGYWAYNSPLFQKIFVNIPALIILSVLLIAMSCFMACATELFRKCALPLFIAFTVVFSLLIGISICGYKSKIILMAAGITFLLVAALTLYACVTKSDFTSCGPYLMVICLVMLIFGIACIFWRDPIVQLIYSCLSALLFAIYLIFDTQLVLGRGQYSYSLDDAYMASIQLYIDIIELFLHLLRILSYFNN